MMFPIAAQAAVQITDLQGIIDGQLAQGYSTVTINPGRYYVAPKSRKHLLFQNLKDVKIVMNGVEMVCTETTQAILIANCTNLTIQGLTIDYDPLPCTQGVIQSMSANNTIHEIELFDGYPDSQGVIDSKYEIFNPDTRTLRWGSYFTFSHEKLDSRRIRITREGAYKGEQVGDIIVINNKHAPGGSIPHGVQIKDSESVTLQDITLFGSNCFGFFETGCSGTHYLRCKIDRRTLENDLKVRADARIRSLDADAFHSKHAIVGPTIEACTARFQGDDCVNICGEYQMIMACNGQTLRVLAKGSSLNIRPGDPIELWSYTGLRLPDAVAVVVTGPVGMATAEELGFLSKQSLHSDFKDGIGPAYQITVNRQIDLPMGSLIAAANRMGNGFRVINCDFGFNRSRGILIKASNGIVRGNVIEGSWGEAIKCSPEFWWLESGSSWNVTFSDNIIKNCVGNGIAVYATSGPGGIAPAGAHGDIVLRNNRITNVDDPHIWVTSTKGLTLLENTYDTILLENCEDVVSDGQVPIIFEASIGFSGVQGDNNWYYQEYNGSTYTDMSWDAAKNRWQGSAIYLQIFSNACHPGSGKDAVRVWEAPEPGVINKITGSVSKMGVTEGNGVAALIYKNSSLLWSDIVAPDTEVTPAGVANIAVSAGDRIYFHINENGNGSYDYTQWNPEIEFSPDKTPPAAPTSLTADAQAGAIDLYWDTNGEIDLDHYNVKRSTVSGSGYATIGSTNAGTTTYTDSTVVPGENYCYVVTAVDTSSNESGDSNEHSAPLYRGDLTLDNQVNLLDIGHLGGGWQNGYRFSNLLDIANDWLAETH